MTDDEPLVDANTARRLVETQFPQWAGLKVLPVATEGWCNRVFHLGSEMVIRMPRHLAYAKQVEKEVQWLPRLAPMLPIPVPEPLAIGSPSEHYPWHWSVYRWIEGATATPERVTSMIGLARQLAGFLVALQRIAPQDGPPPGPHNFYRGGPLATYDSQTREAIAALGGRIDTAAVLEVWERGLASSWQDPPVWIHGDVSVGNLLVRNGQLSAVIDFGNLGIGDPACDLAICWTVFESKARSAFRHRLALDPETWARGRGWALWKALILAAGLASSNAFEASRPWEIIEEVLADHHRADA